MPDQKEQPPKAQSQKKRAKTASKEPDPPTAAELLQKLNDRFGEIYPELEELNSLLRKSGEGPEKDFKDKLLHDDDVRVEYYIRVYARNESPVVVEGDQTLHSFLAQELLPEAVTSFQSLIANNVIRPLQVRFQNILETRIRRRSAPAALPEPSKPDNILPPPINEPKPDGVDKPTDPPKDTPPPPEASGS